MGNISNEITPREAAVKLGIRVDALYRLLWSGKINGRKVDGQWRISAADIDKRLYVNPKLSFGVPSDSECP